MIVHRSTEKSGGQVGDSGVIDGEGFEFCVTDTQKDGGIILHHGFLKSGRVSTGAPAQAIVDPTRRDGIRRAHSATHVLHYALQKNLGTHAQQQGSKVDDDWLRFDFTNMSPVDSDQLMAITADVRERVREKSPIDWKTLPLADARAAGAMMLFGEKYPDPVRMVSMGAFSKELCGGIHLENTEQVGPFEIISEEGVSAGTRRIVALTGRKAAEHVAKIHEHLSDVAKLLNVTPSQLPTAVEFLVRQVRDLKKWLSTGNPTKTEENALHPENTLNEDQAKAVLHDLSRQLNVPMFEVLRRVEGLKADVATLSKQVESLASSGDLSADSLLENSESVGNAAVVVTEIPGGNSNLMRQLIDQIRKKVDSSAILLAASDGSSKVTLVAGVSRDLVERGASAGNWVKEVAPVVGGGGGGKPDMAQAGGKSPENLPQALEKARQVIETMLAD